MNTGLMVCYWLVTLTFVIPLSANAKTLDLLESWNFQISGGTYRILSEVTVSISIGYNDPYDLGTYLYNNIPISTDDIGTSLIASSITSPNFDSFTQLLTNGVDETIEMALDGNAIGQRDSSWLVAKGDALKAYKIDHYELHINSLTINVPGSNPNGDGSWTDYFGDFTFDIYGVVPEPCTISLLALGAVFVRRRSNP